MATWAESDLGEPPTADGSTRAEKKAALTEPAKTVSARSRDDPLAAGVTFGTREA